MKVGSMILMHRKAHSRRKTEEKLVYKRLFWKCFTLPHRKGRNASIYYSHGKVTYVFPGDSFNQNRSSLVIPYSSAPVIYDHTGESTMQILSAKKANSNLGCVGCGIASRPREIYLGLPTSNLNYPTALSNINILNWSKLFSMEMFF